MVRRVWALARPETVMDMSRLPSSSVESVHSRYAVRLGPSVAAPRTVLPPLFRPHLYRVTR